MSDLSLEEGDHRNRYKNGAELAHDKWVEKKWTNIRQTYCDLARDVLRYRTRKSKPGFSQRAQDDLRKGEG